MPQTIRIENHEGYDFDVQYEFDRIPPYEDNPSAEDYFDIVLTSVTLPGQDEIDILPKMSEEQKRKLKDRVFSEL